MGRNWSKRKREKKQFHSKSVVQRMIVKPGMNVPTLSFSPLAAAAAAAAVIYIYLYYKTGWYMHMQLCES